MGDPDGEIARLLRAADCGISIPAGDAEGLAKAIEDLRSDPARCAALGTRARRLLEERFDRPRALARWEVVLQGRRG